MRGFSILAAALCSACAVSPPNEEAIERTASADEQTIEIATTSQAAIVGQWFVDSVGEVQYPAPATGLRANVTFDANGFLSHWASCGGAYPAFYTLNEGNIAISRREAVVYGKCDSAAGERRERALTAALDTVQSWVVNADRLVLTSSDGTVTRLSRPVEPIPALGGDWIVLTIGGAPLGSDRPAGVSFTRGFLGAGADCNSLSTEYEADASGYLRVTGDMLTTLVGCSPDDNAEDSRLFGALGSVNGWSVDGEGRLRLSGPQPMILRRLRAGERD